MSKLGLGRSSSAEHVIKSAIGTEASSFWRWGGRSVEGQDAAAPRREARIARSRDRTPSCGPWQRDVCARTTSCLSSLPRDRRCRHVKALCGLRRTQGGQRSARTNADVWSACFNVRIRPVAAPR